MADMKKGLTPFGWLLVAGAGAYFLGNKERRDKALGAIKGLGGKDDKAAGTATA